MMYAGHASSPSGRYGTVPWRVEWMQEAVELIYASPWAAEDDWHSHEAIGAVLSQLCAAPYAMCYMGTIDGEFGGVYHLNPIRPGHSASMHGYGRPREVAGAFWATGWMVEQAFEGFRVERLSAEFCAENKFFARMLERLGFKWEALLERSKLYRGNWYDTTVYRLLRSEWEARQAQRKEAV